MLELLKGLGQGGPIAIVLAWALWYITTRMQAINAENMSRVEKLWEAHRETTKTISDSMNRLAMADMIRLIASPHVAPEVKDEATKIIREVEPNYDNLARR